MSLLLSAVIAAQPAQAQSMPAQSAQVQSMPLQGQPGQGQEPPVTWVTLGREPAPSLLAVPDHCLFTECALVMVSHPRGQMPERLRLSPEFSRVRNVLLSGNFAVLLSSDGGPTSWGSPRGLRHAAQALDEAQQVFLWNGRTYALGLSMGGLMALRSTLPGSPYPVSGLALIDPWVNLKAAWSSARSRQAEIREAYGTPLNVEQLDPLPLALAHPPLPLFTASSGQDKVVNAALNSERLLPHGEAGYSLHVPLSGPHLGGNRFTVQIGERLLRFFQKLERRADVQAKRTLQ